MTGKHSINRMRKNLFLSAITAFTMILASCHNDDGEPGTNPALVKTIPGGCNNIKSGTLKSAPAADRDTVMFSLRKDTLVIFTGINYICCAPFKTETTVDNDSLIIRLKDTCNYPQENCYCRCMCYYTWEFLFTGLQREKKQPDYKIILDDPRQKEPAVIMQGSVKL